MKDRFYKNFLALYVPLVLQNIITLSVNLTDNIMLGAYGELSLSGAAAVNQIQFVFQQLITALGDGMVIICSQYWGKRQTEPMKKIMVTAMHWGVLLGVILFGITSVWPKQVVGLFTSDEGIIREGTSYLAVVRFTYLFFAVTQLLLARLRSTEIVKIAFILSVMTFCINCGMNYVFIFGRFGMPVLGITGAALGTLTARIVECLVLIFYIRGNKKGVRLGIREYCRFDKETAGDYMRVTFPMVLLSGSWGLNTALQTAILGHMTSAAIAANSAASNLFLMVKSAAVGASSASSVIIGKTIGTGNIQRVKEYSRKLQRIFLLIGLASGVVLFLIRIPVLGLYELSPEAMELANVFLIILSVVSVAVSYQMPTNSGIIKGGGDTGFVVKMDLISIWVIVLPLSFVMAFVVKASPIIVVCCLNADQVFKCIPAYIKVNHGNWIHKLTREE